MIGKVTMPSGIVVTLQESGEYIVTLPEGMAEKYEEIVAGQLIGYHPDDPRDGDGAWHLNFLADWSGGVVEFGSGFQPRPGQCMLEGLILKPLEPGEEDSIVIGKVTTRAGIVAVLYSDWTWDIAGPEDMPPDLAALIKRNLRDTYRSQRPQDGGDTWPLYDIAALEGGTVEVVPGRDYPKDERVY